MASSQDTVVRGRPREQWADNLRVAVIAGVIVVHTATAYVVDIPWYYDDERATSGVWPLLLSPLVVMGALFALGPLFLVAGWFSVRSLAHRGPGGFVRSRLLRLGVPLLVYVLLINPLADYLGNLRQEDRSLASYLGTTEVSVMWFVAALLAFSVAYAALRYLRPAARQRGPLRAGLLAAAALTIAASSFAVWQLWPPTGDMYLNPRLGEWPQGAVLFALGVHAADTGWLENFPPVLARRLGWVAAAGVAALMTLMLYLVLARGEDQALVMGADLPTMLFALLDGVIAVAGTLWFLAWLRGRWPTHGMRLGKAARASYATYFIHPLVLTAIMVLFASVALVPEIKFVLVAAAGVAACFTVGYALTRVPGVSKVL
jgi:surface polysaccharide O-acyltransferase-like enzyme